jgi:FkbM family methyltransferase
MRAGGATLAINPNDDVFCAMLSGLKNNAIVWQLRRSSIWRRYSQNSDRRAEIKFYEGLINASEVGCIIDVGANIGSKTEIFLNLASRVIAIEPDPVSARTLRKRFRWKPVVVREVAISSEPGTVPFYSFGAGSAFNTVSADWAASMTNGANHMGLRLPEPVSINVKAETLVNIETQFRPVKYLKIDAEGFDDQVLSTLNIPIPVVSIEFNFPQMWDAMLTCIERLEKIDPGYRFNVAITEPPFKLKFDKWATGEQIVLSIRAAGWRYVELYARVT